MELNGSRLNMNPAIIRSVEAMFPNLYERSTAWEIAGTTIASDRKTLKISNGVTVAVGRLVMFLPPRAIDLDVAANWDVVSPDYTVAANRAGKDFYIHATSIGKLLISANSTVPTGYTSANSRKVAGFHCLCADVGIISGHPLSGFVAGDILPAGVWDLDHLPVCSPEGMVYAEQLGLWVDIYLMSGTGASTQSAYGATITDSRDWMDFTDDLAAVGKRMLTDAEFQVSAALSNEKTNITGSADPVTTGGHIDTAGRRMISGLGNEDMCGVMNQWLSDQSYKNDDPYGGGFAWCSLPGNKGSLYRQGGSGDVKLLAGGDWSNGSACGSRCRYAAYSRWYTSSYFGSRGCAGRQV
jgi:hypothetical protein